MRRGPAFALPSIPPEWDAVDAVRIVDPVGKAIAWFAPGFGARCLGFSAWDDRLSGAWVQVFSPATRDAADHAIRRGCEVTIDVSADKIHESGDGPVMAVRIPERWTMRERDPTSTRLEAVMSSQAEGGADALALRLQLDASLDDGRLFFAVGATNIGTAACLTRLGLQMTFPVGEVAFGTSIDFAWLRTALRREVELGEGIRDVVTHLSADRQHVHVALRSAALAERPVRLRAGDSTRVVAVVGLGG